MTDFPRAITPLIQQGLKEMPAVFLNGPRQVGKSTLVRKMAGELGAEYITFDDFSILAAAKHDPVGFLSGFSNPVIIDEVQLVPEIFRVLKQRIDEERIRDKEKANGRFLLTGSANVMALPQLADALVGRMQILSLLPLAMMEVAGPVRSVINGLFDQEFTFKSQASERLVLDDLLRKSTYPELVAAPHIQINSWFDSYLTTLLQRDIRALAEIEKAHILPSMVKMIATRAGSLLNDADVARDLGLNLMTYRRYRILLEQLFLIVLVQPWYRNIGKRLVKTPKLFLTDSLLLCHLLGVSAKELERTNSPLFGHLLENFVATEILKQLTVTADTNLYYFRTHDNKEVDFIIERNNGQLLGIEVKTKSTVNEEDFAGLKQLKVETGKDFVRGIVLYGGKDIVSFGDHMVAMPIAALWNTNMEVTQKTALYYEAKSDAYILEAQYGERTLIHCMISQEIAEDYFLNSSERNAVLQKLHSHMEWLWLLFQQKIQKGPLKEIENQGKKVKQVCLEASDFGYKDFRER